MLRYGMRHLVGILCSLYSGDDQSASRPEHSLSRLEILGVIPQYLQADGWIVGLTSIWP